MFYLGSVRHYNRKYKTSEQFREHMIRVNQQIIDNVSPPQEMTKNNKKKIKKKHNEIEMLKFEIHRKKELEELVEKREEEEDISRYRSIEQQKKCPEVTLRCENSCICLEASRNAITISCGHDFFCRQCITNDPD